MQESTTQTPLQTPETVDEIDQISSLLTGEPEKASEAETPAEGEQQAPEKAEEAPAEKPQIDYDLKVPMQDGKEVTLGELKDFYAKQEERTAEIIERENKALKEIDQAQLLLRYIDSLPDHIKAIASRDAQLDVQAEMRTFIESVPEAATKEGRARVQDAIYAITDEYGVPRQTVQNIRDSLTLKMLYDYARLKESVKAAKEKVKPLRSPEPAGQPAAGRNKPSELDQRIAKAKTTRNSADEAAAVDALLRKAS